MPGQRVQPVPIDRQAGQIDRNDGPGTPADGGIDLPEIDQVRCRIDIDEHRPGADRQDHV